MKRSTFAFGLALAVTLLVSSVSAEAASPPGAQPALTDSLRGPAKQAFTSATILLNNNDFVGALSKYEQAYDLSKDPRLLFNMALCARGLKAYAKMHAYLVRYEQEAGPGLSAHEKADVDAALAAIGSFMGTVDVTVNEPGAVLAIDGLLVGTTPLSSPLSLDLGEHTVSITKDGFGPFEQPVKIAGGGQLSLRVSLVPKRHVAQLTVDAEPGATVLVDDGGATIGHFTSTLPSGRHDVRVTAPGKVPYRAKIELGDDESRTLDVTLENEKRGALLWPWIVGGAAVVAGGVVAGALLAKPSNTTTGPPAGNSIPTVNLSSFRGWNGR